MEHAVTRSSWLIKQSDKHSKMKTKTPTLVEAAVGQGKVAPAPAVAVPMTKPKPNLFDSFNQSARENKGSFKDSVRGLGGAISQGTQDFGNAIKSTASKILPGKPNVNSIQWNTGAGTLSDHRIAAASTRSKAEGYNNIKDSYKSNRSVNLGNAGPEIPVKGLIKNVAVPATEASKAIPGATKGVEESAKWWAPALEKGKGFIKDIAGKSMTTKVGLGAGAAVAAGGIGLGLKKAFGSSSPMDTAMKFVKRNPLAAGATALGVGALGMASMKKQSSLVALTMDEFKKESGLVSGLKDVVPPAVPKMLPDTIKNLKIKPTKI